MGVESCCSSSTTISNTHLDVILEVAPVALAAAAPLLLGLDAGPGVPGLPVKLALAAPAPGTSAASTLTAAASSVSAASSSPASAATLAVIIAPADLSVPVALVVPLLPRAVRRLPGV